MKQCYFQNNYGVIAYRKFCSCAPIFNFFCAPQNFPLGENLYQKFYHSRDFRGCYPVFLSYNGEIWHETADLGLPPQAKFCTNRLRGYTPYGQIYTKNTNFGDFEAHILGVTTVKFGVRVQ